MTAFEQPTEVLAAGGDVASKSRVEVTSGFQHLLNAGENSRDSCALLQVGDGVLDAGGRG